MIATTEQFFCTLVKHVPHSYKAVACKFLSLRSISAGKLSIQTLMMQISMLTRPFIAFCGMFHCCRLLTTPIQQSLHVHLSIRFLLIRSNVLRSFDFDFCFYRRKMCVVCSLWNQGSIPLATHAAEYMNMISVDKRHEQETFCRVSWVSPLRSQTILTELAAVSLMVWFLKEYSLWILFPAGERGGYFVSCSLKFTGFLEVTPCLLIYLQQLVDEPFWSLPYIIINWNPAKKFIKRDQWLSPINFTKFLWWDQICHTL